MVSDVWYSGGMNERSALQFALHYLQSGVAHVWCSRRPQTFTVWHPGHEPSCPRQHQPVNTGGLASAAWALHLLCTSLLCDLAYAGSISEVQPGCLKLSPMHVNSPPTHSSHPHTHLAQRLHRCRPPPWRRGVLNSLHHQGQHLTDIGSKSGPTDTCGEQSRNDVERPQFECAAHGVWSGPR
jgi:hypothetical protein